MLTDENDLVVDFFAGSNTTGQVCEELNRKWMSFELDYTYIAASLLRFLPDDFEDNKIKEVYSHVLNGEAIDLMEMGVGMNLFSSSIK